MRNNKITWKTSTKQVEDMYNENYETMRREIENKK